MTEPLPLPDPLIGELSRRGLIEGALVFATLAAIMPCSLAAQSTSANALDSGKLARLALYADAIIPATDTPGATGAGVVDYIALLFTSVSHDEQAAFLAGLSALDAATAGHGSDQLDQGFRTLLQAASGERVPVATRFLRQLKRLVMIGYYTSEVGGSQELVYAPVPGAFVAEVPVTAETRAFSNDTGALL